MLMIIWAIMFNVQRQNVSHNHLFDVWIGIDFFCLFRNEIKIENENVD